MGLAASLGLALFVSPFACSWPDGLEGAVGHLGIQPSRARLAIPALLPDYAVPGVPGRWSTSLAAAAGTLFAFALCGVLGLCLAPRPRRHASAPGAAPVTRP
jgi:hypothetical protein